MIDVTPANEGNATPRGVRRTVTARRAQTVIVVALLIAAVLVPLAPSYYLFVATVSLLHLTAAYGLILPMKAGNISLASAAFIAIGAYTTAVLRLQLQVPFGVAVVGSIVAAGIVATILSALLLRARGAYFIMVTFAFTVLVGHILSSDIELLGGPSGLSGFVENATLGLEGLAAIPTYYLVLGVCVAAGCVVLLAQRSPLQDIWASIRGQEQLASSLGISVRPYAMLAFVLGAMIQGATGSMWAIFYGYIDPSAFTFWLSVAILVYCIVGGSSSNILGVTVAAIGLSILPEALADTPSLYQTAYGVLIALVMLAQVLRFRERAVALVQRINPFRRREQLAPAPDDALASTTGREGGSHA